MRGETAFREGSPGLPSRRWETRRSQTPTRASGSSLRSLHSPPLSCAAPVPTGTAAPLLAVKGCRAPSSHRASTLLAHSARQQRRGRLLTACLCSCAVQRTRAPLRSCRDPASWPSLASRHRRRLPPAPRHQAPPGQMSGGRGPCSARSRTRRPAGEAAGAISRPFGAEMAENRTIFCCDSATSPQSCSEAGRGVNRPRGTRFRRQNREPSTR